MIESPCKRHCCLDDNNVCIGCHRSLDEIRQWSTSNNTVKQEILEKAHSRRISGQISRQVG